MGMVHFSRTTYSIYQMILLFYIDLKKYPEGVKRAGMVDLRVTKIYCQISLYAKIYASVNCLRRKDILP
jgi:hypothetical protein